MRICVECEVPLSRDDWVCEACGFTPPTVSGVPVLAPDIAENNEGWDAAFAWRLSQVESEHFWFRARNKLITWAIRTYFSEARSILDLGCGTGAVLKTLRSEFPELHLTASDGTPESVAIAAEQVAGPAFVQADARSLPYREEFDVAGAFDVIEHIENDTDVLDELYRALRPGGGLLITVPQHDWLWSSADDFSHHKRRYTRGDLVAKVEAAGFTVIRTTSFVTTLLPVLLLSRMRLPKEAENFDPMTEYRVPSGVASLFYGLLRTELALIRLGINLPVGGTLFVVARRSTNLESEYETVRKIEPEISVDKQNARRYHDGPT